MHNESQEEDYDTEDKNQTGDGMSNVPNLACCINRDLEYLMP